MAEQQRHRAERIGAEVAVETGRDDALPRGGERKGCFDDRVVEELHLVDADGVVGVREPQHVRGVLGGDGPHARAGVADDVRDVVAVVDARLHDQDLWPAISLDGGAGSALRSYR